MLYNFVLVLVRVNLTGTLEFYTMMEVNSTMKPMLDNDHTVLCSTPSVYHPVTWMLLSIAPISTVGSLIAVLISTKDNLHEFWKSLAILGSATLAVLGIYGVVLPKRVCVHSDASLSIQTLLYTHRFRKITSASHFESIWSGMGRPKWKFATDFGAHRVVVHRQNGWDVTVSPQNVKGFLRAVERACGSST